MDARFLVEGPLAIWLESGKHHAVGVQHVVHLAGVDPVAVHDLGIDTQPAVDETLDCVGDFQLTAPGWREPRDDVVDGGVEHVDPDNGEIAFWLARLLHEASHAPFDELGDAERLGVGDRMEEDLRRATVGCEPLNVRLDATHDEVVAEVEHKA